MEKIKKIIIVLAIIIVILLIAISIITIKLNKSDQIDENVTNGVFGEAEKNDKLHIEQSRNRFYIVKSCVERFYQYYQGLNPENADIKLSDEQSNFDSLQKGNAEKIYAILDKEYIAYKNITPENISNKLGKIGKVDVFVDKVYTKDLEQSSYICFVEGRVKEKTEVRNFKMVVRLGGTETFKIFLEDYLNEKNYNFSEDIDITNLCNYEISNDKYNTYKTEIIDNKEYINDLFKHYKNTVIKDQKYSYQLIEETYRNIRFENIDEYLKYVKENYATIMASTLSTYSNTTVDGATQYICEDKKGKIYIFNETAPFQYTVALDNYTIPIKDFTEEYNSSSEKQKVVLNIKRFFMGIDDKNYGYSYSVLSQAFKSNKYPTKNDFINYAKQTFFTQNEIESITCEKENGVYICKVTLKDNSEAATTQKSLNIIMKLNSGTDFEMSFGQN